MVQVVVGLVVTADLVAAEAEDLKQDLVDLVVELLSILELRQLVIPLVVLLVLTLVVEEVVDLMETIMVVLVDQELLSLDTLVTNSQM